MAAYILRDIDKTLWDAVKARAAKDGHQIRWVLLALLRSYVENVKITLCKCHVVTGGHLAVNESCPLHGDPAYVEYLKGEIDPRD
jgi:hypothetical protein